MGADEPRTSRGPFGKGPLDRPLRSHVEGRRRLVEGQGMQILDLFSRHGHRLTDVKEGPGKESEPRNRSGMLV